MQIRTFPLKSGLGRLVVVSLCVVAVALALLVSKWAFGHAVAINASEKEVAELGVSLAPSDPQAHLVHGLLLEKTLLPEDQAAAIRELEYATALSPHNYINWLALGRTREQAGDPVGAEQSLRRAIELAPNYSRVNWALGNLLVRQGRDQEGFSYIRNSVAADVTFVNPAAAAAWQAYSGDIAKIRAVLGESPNSKTAVALLLSANKRFADALALWKDVSDPGQQSLKEPAQILFSKFIEAGRLRSAIEVANSAGLFPADSPAVGSVANGGFESALTPKDSNIFSWVVADGSYPRVGLNDAQKRNGNYSLLMNFGPGGKGFRPLSQKIGVEPGGVYNLSFHYLSELKTESKLVCQVISIPDAKVIASMPIPAASAWSEISASINVPAEIEGIELKIAAEGCRADGCSISGNIWFDDFSLARR